MKTHLLLLLILGSASAHAQLPPLFITRFEVPGQLAWTNRLCPLEPVYEVLRADQLTGPWQRVTLLTNQTSLPLAVSPGGTAFYRVAWVGETTSVFNYTFDEGYGAPAVTGTLRLGLRPGASGTWSFHETAFVIDGRHPVGNGLLNHSGALVTPTNETRLRAYLVGSGIEGTVYLEGLLQRGEVGGPCTYTGFSGAVYQVTLADTVAIGTFTAVRAP